MKLIRFFVVVIFTIILFCFLYCIVPSIIWLFGGNFLEVAQSPAHAVIGTIIYGVLTGGIINETVDEDFRFIK